LGNGLEQLCAASMMPEASSVHEPSGALGAGVPNASGFADTFGSRSSINAARR